MKINPNPKSGWKLSFNPDQKYKVVDANLNNKSIVKTGKELNAILEQSYQQVKE